MATKQERFAEVLSHFKLAMLVTHGHDGSIHGRPMMIADSNDSGELWFITSMDSEKVDELCRDPGACVTMQSSTRQIALSGDVEIIRDRALLDEKWSIGFDPWFENGKDDPEAALIRFRTRRAEYWDGSGLKGLRYMFEATKALVTGGTVSAAEAGDHAALRP